MKSEEQINHIALQIFKAVEKVLCEQKIPPITCDRILRDIEMFIKQELENDNE